MTEIQDRLLSGIRRKVERIFELLGTSATLHPNWATAVGETIEQIEAAGTSILFIGKDASEKDQSLGDYSSVRGDEISGIIYFFNRLPVPTVNTEALLWNGVVYRLTAIEKSYFGNELVVLKIKATR